MTQLFEYASNAVDPTLVKIAGTPLDEDVTTWPRKILAELYRALPEVTEYVPEVHLLQVDEERGYGLGVVVLSNTPESGLASSETVPGATRATALLPVVIRANELYPLDIVLSPTGAMYPLTAARLREVLFRADTFSLTAAEDGSSSLGALFHPPGRSSDTLGSGAMPGLGGGGTTTIMGNGMKFAGLPQTPLLPALAGKIAAADVEKLAAQLCTLPTDVALSPAFRNAIAQIDAGAEKVAALDDAPEGDVIYLNDTGAGMFDVLIADRAAGVVKQAALSRGEVAAYYVQKANTAPTETKGLLHSTPAEGARVVEDARGAALRVMEAPCTGTVYTVDGRAFVGHIVPGLLDPEGVLPVHLFICETFATVASTIAASADGRLPPRDLLRTDPKGRGVFWFLNDAANVRATTPVTVKGVVVDGAGRMAYQVVDDMGDALEIVLSPGLPGIVTSVTPPRIYIPQGAGFAPLTQVELIGTAGHAPSTEPSVKVAHLGQGQYTLSFSSAQPKLAELFPARTPFSEDVASFALCALGLSAGQAKVAMATAQRKGHVYATGPVFAEAEGGKKHAALDVSALRHTLIKEAAALTDTQTVDAVLSLGLLTPENVDVFISRIPYLERALTMLCEFVLAGRCGYTEIPESAASRAAKALDASLSGLKALALRKIDDVA